MSVYKYLRFAAPYRSKTFNEKDALLIGQNGVLAGGEVSQSGSVVTIQPITFIQNGQIIDIPDTSLSANTPPNLAAPYYIALSVSSPIENVSEVITPTFVKRPQDVNSQVVLVAEYDGTEWRQLPRLQTQARIAEEQLHSVDTGMTGVAEGLDVTADGTTLTIAPGVLVDAGGQDVTKDASTSLTQTAAPATLSRIDTVVFRKPSDSPYRIGTFKYVPGPTYSPGSIVSGNLVSTSTGTAATQCRLTKLSDGTTMIVTYLDGTTLYGATVSTDGSTIGTPFQVATLVDQYDVAADFDGYMDFSYIRSTTLYHIRVSKTGAIIQTEAQLYTSLKTLHDPQIEVVGTPTSYVMHIAVCRELTGTDREIGYVRLASDGSIITSYVQWIDLSSSLQKPCFAKDDDDSLLFMSFENDDTGRAYLWTFDASSATTSTPPTQLGSSVELQTDVYNTVTSTAMPSTGATDTRVIRTDNKETFVFWKHFKGAGSYGIGIYNAKYQTKFGHKAVMLDDSNTSFFGVDMDGMNNAYFVFGNTGDTQFHRTAFNLETLDENAPDSACGSLGAATDVAAIFDFEGSVYAAAGGLGSLFAGPLVAGIERTLQDYSVCSSDIYIAQWRTADDTLVVADTSIGEMQVIRRLYEFNNVFGASGVVSWNVVGSNKLATSAITLRFLTRTAVYTLNANVGGFTIPDGYVLYVNLPDADTNTTLTATVAKFGSEMLDRHKKTTFALFWNVGGRLYSNFAPYSFSQDGETVVIGGTISNELMAWLGILSSAPDASNHGYGSTNFILESDSIVAAIGKLDVATSGVATSLASASIPLFAGNTSVTVTYGAARANANYALTASFLNVTDAEPMFQSPVTTAKTANGFTVSWPSPLDTGDYVLDYILRDN